MPAVQPRRLAANRSGPLIEASLSARDGTSTRATKRARDLLMFPAGWSSGSTHSTTATPNLASPPRAQAPTGCHGAQQPSWLDAAIEKALAARTAEADSARARRCRFAGAARHAGEGDRRRAGAAASRFLDRRRRCSAGM